MTNSDTRRVSMREKCWGQREGVRLYRNVLDTVESSAFWFDKFDSRLI